MQFKLKVNGSTASWPGSTPVEAIQKLLAGVEEPLLGRVHTDHIQICPQNRGVLDEAGVAEILASLPRTSRPRLHANVRVFSMATHGSPGFSPNAHDASTGMKARMGDSFFKRIAELSNMLKAPAYTLMLKAPAYTLHAGARNNANLETMKANVLEVQELMQIPVGVEGLYPQGGRWLIQDWSEYAWLLNSGLKYAIDMSHLHIVATQSGRYELNLVKELISSSNCIEAHISGNDGDRDSHQVVKENFWWLDAMPCIHENCVIFAEGDHRKH